MTNAVHSRPWWRTCDIALRTAHIGVSGVLFGGHVFGITPRPLLPWLYWTVATGALLAVLEAYPSWHWIIEGRGVLVIAKVLLTCSVVWFWDQRAAILAAVIVIGCIGSHMPRRLRYYSLK